MMMLFGASSRTVSRAARAEPTYLKLTNRRVGLVINFGAPTLREGLRRIVNGFQPSAFPRLRVNQRVPGNVEQGPAETA